MAAIQSNGNATTATSTNNNHGTIRRGGNIAGTKFEASSLGSNVNGPQGGQTVFNGDDATKAISAGDFANNNQEGMIMRVTDVIADGANTTLRSGGAEKNARLAVSKIETVRTDRVATSIRQGDWVEFSGAFRTTPSGAADSFGNDHAARPTRATPGEFVIKEHKLAPVLKDYPANNG